MCNPSSGVYDALANPAEGVGGAVGEGRDPQMYRMVKFVVRSFARSSLLRDLITTALIIIVGPRISSQTGEIGRAHV